jgi:hypothetical protein
LTKVAVNVFAEDVAHVASLVCSNFVRDAAYERHLRCVPVSFSFGESLDRISITIFFLKCCSFVVLFLRNCWFNSIFY